MMLASLRRVNAQRAVHDSAANPRTAVEIDGFVTGCWVSWVPSSVSQVCGEGDGMRVDQAQAYVESLLERLLGEDKVVPDGDGDYPVLYGNAPYYVRVVGRTDPVVQVFSIALDDVEESPELLSRLNEVNADVSFARLFHVRGQVLIETDVLAESLDPASFHNACQCVGSVTLNVAPGLHERFGGRLTFVEKAEGHSTEPRNPAPTGQYL